MSGGTAINGNGRASASTRLLALRRSVDDSDETLTLGQVIDSLGQAGLGLVLLILTLPSLIPLPGPFGMLFGTLIAIVSLQVLFGAHRVWLPEILRRRRVSPGLVRSFVDKGVPILQRVEGRLKPRRMLPLTNRAARIALAVPLLVMAIVLALPIPLGNVGPCASLIAFALGFIQRDGLAVLVGLGLSALTLVWTAVLIVFGAAMFDWISGFVSGLLGWA